MGDLSWFIDPAACPGGTGGRRNGHDALVLAFIQRMLERDQSAGRECSSGSRLETMVEQWQRFGHRVDEKRAGGRSCRVPCSGFRVSEERHGGGMECRIDAWGP